jgi:hypothetical protein
MLQSWPNEFGGCLTGVSRGTEDLVHALLPQRRHGREGIVSLVLESHQYLMGNHTIAERMFRHETAMTKLRSPRVPTSDRD